MIRRRRRSARNGPPAVATEPVRTASTRLSLRLIQIHLCVIYLWAGLAKLKGTAWWTGEALWRVLANAEYQTADLTWLAWFPWIPETLSLVTVAWEISFCALVWNRHLRPLVLAMGTAMHVGIGAFLGMWTFGLIMCVAYLAFLEPERLRSVTRAVRGRAGQRHRSDRALTLPGGEVDSGSVTAPEALSGVSISPTDDAMTDLAADTPAEQPHILLFARRRRHRDAVKQYFEEHDYRCTVVGALSDVPAAAETAAPSVVLMLGKYSDGIPFAEVVRDLVRQEAAPVAAVVTTDQRGHILTMTMPGTVDLADFPISHRNLRSLVSGTLARRHG